MDCKKAFEQMKKEIKKELGIIGGFTMSNKQIALGTATYLVCNTIPYEEEIAYHKKSCDRVREYKSWTDAEKERFFDNASKYISFYENELSTYGTKEEFARQIIDKIVNSKAFAKFSEALGGVSYNAEVKNNGGLEVIYLRFNYNV